MIKSLVNQIEDLLVANIDGCELQYFENYKKVAGATDNEIQMLENEFGISLPADFKELYKYKNGTSYPLNFLYTTYDEECITPFYLLSLDEIRKTKTYFCNEDKLMKEYCDFFTDEKISKLDKRIKPYLQNKQWIPFAQLAHGSLYLMLDFDPTEKGSIAQIIVYVHDPDFIYYVSKDIRGLLEDTIYNLEDGCYDEFN